MSYEYYNPNPSFRSTGDCVIRALSKALGQTWDETYVGLCAEGFGIKDWGNCDEVWGRYLYRNGFRRRLTPDDRLGRYTVEDFVNDHPHGVYILSIPGRHVVAVVDGVYYDSWRSGNETPGFYWAKERI